MSQENQLYISEYLFLKCAEFVEREPETVNVLDIGCGRGTFLSKELKSKFHNKVHITGIDSENFSKENSYVDHFIVGQMEEIDSSHIQKHKLLYAHFVCEHLRDLPSAFGKAAALADNNAYFVISTLNPNSVEYLVSSRTPHQFHKWFKKTVEKCPENQVFPTTYPFRSVKKIAADLHQGGFAIDKISYFHGTANYMRGNFVLRFLGRLYEALLNALGLRWMATHVVLESHFDKNASGERMFNPDRQLSESGWRS